MSLYPDWQEEHKNDPPLLPERIRVMHGVYGIYGGHVCGDCEFMTRIKYAKTFLKCSKSAITRGPGTDWRAKWPACGLYQEDK